MSTITKERAQQIFLGNGPEPTASEERELARIALASLEAEAVAFRSKLRPPTAIGSERWDYTDHRQPDAFELENCIIERLYTAQPAPANAEPVAWLWSHRKHPSEVSIVRPEDDERAEGAHWSGWSCQALYAAPPAPVSLPDYPDVLPCPVMLEPGLRFGKGVPTKTMLGALLRRTEYHAELEAMTPEQRADHDAGMKEFAAMLQGADGALTNEDTKKMDELVMWIKRLAHSLRKASPDSKLQSDAMDYLSRKGLIGVKDILR